MNTEKEKTDYDELCAYALSLREAAFIHQHVVDAWAAQHATENSKPISVAFALIGLYLHLEEGYSGREVQRVHLQLANPACRRGKARKQWPRFPMPAEPAKLTASDVLAVSAGREREEAIDRWCASVWEAWKESQEQVREWAKGELRIDRKAR